jgi:hypothetical protein
MRMLHRQEAQNLGRYEPCNLMLASPLVAKSLNSPSTSFPHTFCTLDLAYLGRRCCDFPAILLPRKSQHRAKNIIDSQHRAKIAPSLLQKLLDKLYDLRTNLQTTIPTPQKIKSALVLLVAAFVPFVQRS